MHSSTGPIAHNTFRRNSLGEDIWAYTDSNGVVQHFPVPPGCDFVWHNGRYQVFEVVQDISTQDRPNNPRQPTDQQGADGGRREAAD